jgi:hypothetical protein
MSGAIVVCAAGEEHIVRQRTARVPFAMGRSPDYERKSNRGRINKAQKAGPRYENSTELYLGRRNRPTYAVSFYGRVRYRQVESHS